MDMKFKFKIQEYQINAVEMMVNDYIMTNSDQVFATYSLSTTRKVL